MSEGNYPPGSLSGYGGPDYQPPPCQCLMCDECDGDHDYCPDCGNCAEHCACEEE